MRRSGSHRPGRSGRLLSLIVLTVTACVTMVLGSSAASAAPVTGTSRIESVEKLTGQRWVINVYSASMDTVVPLDVVRPADTSVPRPILYALNGGGIGVIQGSGWFESTDIATFYQDKNANVVSPRAGNYSYYTDWVKDDPVLGRNKWETFLTKEIPPLLNAELGSNGIQSIIGMSMSAGSAMDLAIQSGDLYSGVASFTGCTNTSDPLGRAYVQTVVGFRGNGNVDNMWGPPGDPRWAQHDVYLNAEKLRGKALYVTARNGIPGPYDTLDNPRVHGDLNLFGQQVVLGGGIEVAVAACTQRLVDKLHALDIPVTTDLGDPGTHSWDYLQHDLHNSWPLLARSMGLEP